MKRRNKKKKSHKRNIVEVFELTEKGREFMDLIREANVPTDDTLSMEALGLWVSIWLMYRTNDRIHVTVQKVLKEHPHEQEILQVALFELQTKGHIRIDQNQIITLNQ